MLLRGIAKRLMALRLLTLALAASAAYAGGGGPAGPKDLSGCPVIKGTNDLKRHFDAAVASQETMFVRFMMNG